MHLNNIPSNVLIAIKRYINKNSLAFDFSFVMTVSSGNMIFLQNYTSSPYACRGDIRNDILQHLKTKTKQQ